MKRKSSFIIFLLTSLMIITVNVSAEIEPYKENFENVTIGQMPEEWDVQGDISIIELENGNRVLQFMGKSDSNIWANLIPNNYSNIKNFRLKFKARYKVIGENNYNLWRIRYRTTDSRFNNSVEWGSHNKKYFIMRKTPVGGNYFIGNYRKDLSGGWHEYEVKVMGARHQLYIDGEMVINGLDTDESAPEEGFFQFNVVNGIKLDVDDFSIIPMEKTISAIIEPGGNSTGIYEKGDDKGLSVYIEGDSKKRGVKVVYKIQTETDEIISEGQAAYTVEANTKIKKTILFNDVFDKNGVYYIYIDVFVDGNKVETLSNKLNIAVIRGITVSREVDRNMDSIYGFNTHYSLNWPNDIINAVRKTGARHHRSHLNWQSVDNNQYDAGGKKIYNFAEYDHYFSVIESYGLNNITILNVIRNHGYQDTGDRTISDTDALQALDDFVYNAADRYKGRVNYWEMPNEPTLFARPYIPYEIIQLQKRVYLNMKKGNSEAVLIAGDHTSAVRKNLPGELELDSYYYADAYSWHPYTYRKLPDFETKSFVDDIRDMINEYGGWKDFYITEGGFSTSGGNHGAVVSEAGQRDFITRLFLNYMTMDQVKVWEYYTFKNNGSDKAYYNVNWGITDINGRPKLAYPAVNNLMILMNNPSYVGRLQTDGNPYLKALVFLQDYKPIIIPWLTVDYRNVDPVYNYKIPVGKPEVTLVDVYGNKRSADTIDGILHLEVTGSPTYILNADQSIVNTAAQNMFLDKYNQSIKCFNKIKEKSNINHADIDMFIDRLHSIHEGLLNIMKSNKTTEIPKILEKGIDDIYKLMSELTVNMVEESKNQAPVFVTLESLYNYAEAISRPLLMFKNNEGTVGIDIGSQNYVKDAESIYKQKKGEHGLLPISTVALSRAKRYGEISAKYYQKEKYTEAYVYNLLAEGFAKVVCQMVKAEKVRFTGLWMNIKPAEIKKPADNTFTIHGDIINDTDKNMSAELVIDLPCYKENNNLVYQDIAGNSKQEFEIEGELPEEFNNDYLDVILMMYDGEVVDMGRILFTK